MDNTKHKFHPGDIVRKTSGSELTGAVISVFSSKSNPERCLILNDNGEDSIEVWPASMLEMVKPAIRPMNLNELSQQVHAANINWWRDIHTGLPIQRNKGELLALIHSEISEALEGERKNLMDDKLPHRKMAEVELADALIRILDYCGGFGYDLQGAFEEKMAYNAQRKDHQHEARKQAGGKAW